MNAWTDFEEALNALTDFGCDCEAEPTVNETVCGVHRLRNAVYDKTRAAVEEAKREEREACAAFVLTHHYVNSSVAPHHQVERNPLHEADRAQRTLAAAILVRGDKEPRDAER